MSGLKSVLTMSMIKERAAYLPTRDEWIEININKLSYVLGIASPYVG